MKDKSNKKVCIVGLGKIGSALASILREKGVETVTWHKSGANLRDIISLGEAIGSADFILLCVPSWAVCEVMTKSAPYFKKGAIVISLAKGVELKNGKTMDELLKDFIPLSQIALLGGPMLANDLKMGGYGIGVVAASNRKVGREVTGLFKGTRLKVEYSSDLHGVALASILKNIYALGLGIADGLAWGENRKGWLVGVSFREMSKAIKVFGGKSYTVMTSAGLGDLAATGYSHHSRNRKVGEELTTSFKGDITSEGIISVSRISSMLKKHHLKLPLFNAIESVVDKKQKAKTAFNKLFEQII